MEVRDAHTIIQTGLTTRALSERRAVPYYGCRVLRGPDAGVEITLGMQAIIVGAGPNCELTLTDPKVSRQHVQLSATASGIAVKDLGSTNGVSSQGSRITEVVLPPGATIELGDTALRFFDAQAPTMPPSDRQRFGGLVGESLAMREVFAILELASPTESTLLLQGESGTGKELAARAIHDHSTRSRGPFVVADCSVASEQLIDSQLFGHLKGAFTGAASTRKGAFVQAHGGTLFLDELGELPLGLQVKLLRAIEARTVQPVGSDEPVEVDVRIIGATNRDLDQMVANKTFRFDLFHRLAVVHLLIPPLREHLEDLRILVQSFYEGRDADPGELTGENLDRLTQHNWPGNVRELRNVLERAWVLSGRDKPAFADLRIWLRPDAGNSPAFVDTALPYKEAKERWLDVFERRYLAAIYRRFEGNISRSADFAGINRRHFRTLLQKHDLRERDE